MDIFDFDLDQSIRDYEYTKRAVYDMNTICDSEQFQNMDTEQLFDYISKEMNIVSFSDYLKRYLYEKAEIEEPFTEIGDDVYLDILEISFRERRAPFSFRPTSRKEKRILKDLVTSRAVSRETIFVLGFGLDMAEDEVKDFLVKVNMESSFDFQKPEEVIYWFCYKYHYNYSFARKMMTYFEEADEEGLVSVKYWEELKQTPKIHLLDEEQLKLYLKYMKRYADPEERSQLLYDEFMKIYRRCQEAVASYYEKISYRGADKKWKPDDIHPADMEKLLCSGIPVNKQGNLVKMSLSLLSKHFQNKRMSRARVNGILNRTHSVERFDLITMLFLYYSLEVEPDWPTERCMQYTDEINTILSSCSMMGIYPANPYEAFILLCLLSELPLTVYSDVFEKSYEHPQQ